MPWNNADKAIAFVAKDPNPLGNTQVHEDGHGCLVCGNELGIERTERKYSQHRPFPSTRDHDGPFSP